MGEGNDIDRLIELAELVKSQNILVALYSGSDIINQKYYKIFDYIKIGRYIKEKGGLNSPTTNQKLYQLKDDNFTDITYLFHKTN
jgi:anaerobic ribonucleoside-triphosphate reductase activating protein